MEVVIQKCVRFLFFMSLYFSSLENAFCYTAKGHYLSRIFGGNNHFNDSKDSKVFSVLDYGAKGDGVANDATAFKTAWDAACKTNGGILLVPSGYTFLLQTVTFEGTKCQPNIVVQVEGKIVAPNKSAFVNVDVQWILFVGLSKGIQIKGKGTIDGSGASWWQLDDKSRNPHALFISKSVNVTVTGITIQNSPRMHIFFSNCQQVKIYDFTVNSPGNSPNTDGIHLSAVQHADIHNSTLACGDDCISIQSGCSDVKIYNVHCGPGHGYSIGGLGPNGEVAQVSDISVLSSTVHDALNGVRIKTWPGGSGSVQGVVFSGITVSNVKEPIVIDQNYCGGSKQCTIPNKQAVAVSNVSFTDIQGTYSDTPVSLVCSQYVPCKYLTFTNIDIMPTPEAMKKPMPPYCVNAYGQYSKTIVPSLKDCLLPHTAPSPTVLPSIESSQLYF